MAGQSLTDQGESLNVRWATDDSNPEVARDAQVRKLQRVVDAARAAGDLPAATDVHSVGRPVAVEDEFSTDGYEFEQGPSPAVGELDEDKEFDSDAEDDTQAGSSSSASSSLQPLASGHETAAHAAAVTNTDAPQAIPHWVLQQPPSAASLLADRLKSIASSAAIGTPGRSSAAGASELSADVTARAHVPASSLSGLAGYGSDDD